jgi:hypothetical protein
MRVGRRLFPYPVMNNQEIYSSYKNTTFSFNYVMSQDDKFFILDDIFYITDNENLEVLIESGKVEVFCIVECSSTIFRKAYVLTKNPSKIEIPINNLQNRVVVSTYAYAKENLSNFHDNDFLEDYSEYKFNIEKYDILAVDDGFTTKINYDTDKDDKVSSIFQIIKESDNKTEKMRLELEDERKIKIYLPEKEFDLYDKMKMGKYTKSIFFSIFIIPALSQALLKLQQDDIEDIRLKYNWFSSIEKKYQELYGMEMDNDALANLVPIDFAQEVMNFPVTKSIEDMFYLAMNGLGEEDYE